MGHETNSGAASNPIGSPGARTNMSPAAKSRPRAPGPDEQRPARSEQRGRATTEAKPQQEEGSTITTGATPPPRAAKRTVADRVQIVPVANAPPAIPSDSDEDSRKSVPELRALTRNLDETTSAANIARLRGIVNSFIAKREIQRQRLDRYTSNIERAREGAFFPPRPIYPDRNFRFVTRSARIVSGIPIPSSVQHLALGRPFGQPAMPSHQPSIEENMESAWLAKTRINLLSWYIHEYKALLERRNNPARFKARLRQFRTDLDVGSITRVDLDSYDDARRAGPGV